MIVDWSRRAIRLVFAFAWLVIAALSGLSGCQDAPPESAPNAALLTASVESTSPVSYRLQTGLPARATKTPTHLQTSPQTSLTPPTALVVPTAIGSPVVTSPFIFPTDVPAGATATAVPDCTAVFPIESIEAIRFGQTTTAQLEAAFGHAESVGGRPPTYRFVARGCVLSVAIEGTNAQEAELAAYGTLDWLLDRYGDPAAVGISEGNLVLLVPGQTVLLYPARGMIAVFDALPGDLARTTALTTLYVRPAYEVERQIARLKLAVVDAWVPPLR